ncbi:MAG: dihydrofolate reductase [Alphaproteobacteria bacterium]|nr:dihydrofolate reductase [Alphaproteobacteria bacterium]
MPTRPPIIIVAAIARNRVIGADGGLPWHLPADMRRFKAITLGKPMIMGRKTFESIGRPLPGRRTIVVTRDSSWSREGVDTATTIEAALMIAAEAAPEAVIIAGGGEIYRQTLPLADRLRLTWVDAEAAGDTLFPEVDWTVWREASREDHPTDGGQPGYSFVDYERM